MNLHPEFSTNDVIAIAMAVLVIVTLIIIAGRLRVYRATKQDLSSKYKDKVWASPLEARTKYPDVEVFRFRRFGFLFGIACSLILTTTLMNWTIEKTVASDFEYATHFESDIEITPPQTTEPPLPPPPPPPPVVIEVPDELVADMEESVEFMDQSIEAEAIVDAPPAPEPKAPAVIVPPPPPPPKEDVEEIFKVVEEMPRFPGCEGIAGSISEKKACADKALLEFIHANLEYPPYARENNIQGTVVVQFVVNRDGTIQDAQVLRDIGAGCGKEVRRVVDLMNVKNLLWTPGKQRGSPVRVIFILPVKFTLLSS
ncbi:MAG TPA: energy transducer TonB [Saprospiraceae bacterium]|nr:energy transducer TonB [Saprospiraceae bacterium]